MPIDFSRQIENRNFMSPTGFLFSVSKYPKISFFSNKCAIPGIAYPELEQPTAGLNILPIPATTPRYEELIMNFMVDENMVNYAIIYNWIIGMGFPESTEQYDKFTRNEDGRIDTKEHTSDGSLSILNSNYNPIVNIKFFDLFPTSISSLPFDSTVSDVNYLTAQATFRYSIYNILDKNGKLYEPG
jgi:hypothetical protein